MKNNNAIIEQCPAYQAVIAGRAICVGIDVIMNERTWEIKSATWKLLGFSKTSGELVLHTYQLKPNELQGAYAVQGAAIRMVNAAPSKFIAQTQLSAGKSPAQCVAEVMNATDKNHTFVAANSNTVNYGNGRYVTGGVDFVITPQGVIYITKLD